MARRSLREEEGSEEAERAGIRRHGKRSVGRLKARMRGLKRARRRKR